MVSFNKEQIYIVTGASSGIGEAAALLLNKLGASVVAIARDLERLNKMRANAEFPENIYIEQKDLTDDIDNLPSYVKSLREKYGKFSGMAYCAGVTGIMPLAGLTYDYMKNIFDINYFAPIFMIKGFANKKNHITEGGGEFDCVN